jgi:hypothetical protein
MAAAMKIADAAAPIDPGVDLRTRQFTTSAEVDAPNEGKALTRINWLLRRAKDMPPRLRNRGALSERSRGRRRPARRGAEAPRATPYNTADPKREARTIRLALTEELGLKRDAGQGSFLGASRDHVKSFYREVLQPIRP